MTPALDLDAPRLTYRFVFMPHESPHQITSLLNAWAGDGWRVVSHTGPSNQGWYTFVLVKERPDAE